MQGNHATPGGFNISGDHAILFASLPQENYDCELKLLSHLALLPGVSTRFTHPATSSRGSFHLTMPVYPQLD
jgi:hypothetical protein